MSKIIGIDISKQTFDICFMNEKENPCWTKYSNDLKGFKKFYCTLKEADWCIMEASGPYYLKLAYFLYGKAVSVSVINPLVIKRYSQMLMSRAKTDKKDAEIICRYGLSQKPILWSPKEESTMKMQQIMTALEAMEKQLRISKNQQEAFSKLPVIEKEVQKSINKIIGQIEKEIKKLEQTLDHLANTIYKESMDRLTSIPGIGRKTAIALIVATNNFKNFESSKQLISYVGFSPRIYESGTSVKGKGRITKMGMGSLRKKLYVCGLTAKNLNVQCKQLFDRLKEKGKNGKLAIVAVANKLLKQAFGIIKTGTYYDKNLLEKTCF